MAQTDGQEPILYVEDGSMAVLPHGATPMRHATTASQRTIPKGASAAHGEGEKAAGGADEEDVSDVMAALEKQEKAPFPEGGKEAWLTVLGVFCCTMVTFGVLNTYGVYQAYFKQTYLSNYSNFAINWIGTAQYVGIFGAGLPMGKLFDLGFFRPCFLVGAVMLTASQLGLSFANSFATLFVAQGLFMGIGMGIVFNMAIACPSHWFLKRRGMALGLAAAGSSTGGGKLSTSPHLLFPRTNPFTSPVCFPIMIQRLIPRIGFGWSMRVIFFIEIVMLTIAWFTIRTRLPPAIDVRDKSKGGWKQVKWIDIHAFKNPAYTMIVIGFGLVVFGLYTPFTYMDVFTSHYKIPANGYFLSIMNAASMFGRILPGFVADKVGRTNTILPFLTLAGILLFIFPLCTSLGGLIPFAILYGFASGGHVSLQPAVVAQLGPTESVGVRVGNMIAFQALGSVCQPFVGLILGGDPETGYRWWGACAFSGALVLSGASCLMIGRFFALGGKLFGRI
ncbi:hypothetical protein QFC22_004857 [Naganishia vaughanmartiniae]|uniref:Uncharacterized protein n=1 Tax=Naganishia vaughanmartiniae TaxID=1424756 RepID=A0ACC2WZ47_9TREE|nr:hypothetical protein QFC22_004857 [Naganishia vaughanmartiniae]